MDRRKDLTPVLKLSAALSLVLWIKTSLCSSWIPSW
jgi:hypothetical protein